MTQERQSNPGYQAWQQRMSLLYARLPHWTAAQLFEQTPDSLRGGANSALSPERRGEILDLVSGPLRPGLYIEVGHGRCPYVEKSPRTFTKESQYVGIEGGTSKYDRPTASREMGFTDEDPYMLQHVQPRLEELASDYVHFVRGDANNLDKETFPDGCAQEIFMGDVVLAPGMKPEGMYEMFSEARRLLSEGGVLIIGESPAGYAGYRNMHDVPSSSTDKIHLRKDLAAIGIILDELGFKERMVPKSRQEVVAINSALQWHGGDFLVAVRGPEVAQPAGRRGWLERFGIARKRA